MAKPKFTLPEVVSKIYDLLEPLDSAERVKVIQSASALLGQTLGRAQENERTPPAPSGGGTSGAALPIGARARRWMDQNGLTDAAVEEVFHFNGGTVETIASDIPGESKKEKTRNCYLLAGVRDLLETDQPAFQDDEAVALCKNMRCHDSANNATTRKRVGLSGSKKDGFALTAPCLRDAATLLSQIATTTK